MSRQGKMSGGYPSRDDEKNQEKRKHNKSDTIQHRNGDNSYENRHNILKRDDMKTSDDYAKQH
jgi:hypothetical protein